MLAETDSLAEIRGAMENPSISPEELVDRLKSRGHLVITEDGSYTLRSSQGEELMHSRIGAMKEAFEKFARPSGIEKIESPKILDLCSGLGYNALAALEINSQSRLYMVEISPEMLYLSLCLPIPCKSKVLLDRALNDFFSDKKNKKIEIHCGDARKILSKTEEGGFDAVFHDGFSPGNDPVLYSVEFLTLINNLLSDKGILLSYSSSIPFRSSLIEAGFYIGEGPAVGRKRGITIASPSASGLMNAKRLSLQDEMLIALSTTGVPFRDPDLNWSDETILSYRESKRELIRESGKYIAGKRIRKGNVDSDFVQIRNNYTDSRSAIIEMKKKLSIDI